MHSRISVGEWHIGIDLRNDPVGRLNGGTCHIARDSETDKAILIRHRTVQENDIDTPCAVTYQLRNFSQKTGSHRTVALVYPFAEAVVDKE